MDSSKDSTILENRFNRREFVAATVGGVITIPSTAKTQVEPSADLTVAVRLRINGKPYEVKVDPRVTLLDLLREQLSFTGTKKGCDHGQCGACTVLVDGTRINSCLSLAVMNENREITTIEGLAQGEHLHSMQAAFVEHDGLQCGYCTPGQICSAVAMLEEANNGAPSCVSPRLDKPGPIQLTDNEIRERMSGNICRCGAYVGIRAAIRSVSERQKA